ncbi:hypothetical protein DsansV1_C05g0057851 [Dioscorea sansibarensis]
MDHTSKNKFSRASPEFQIELIHHKVCNWSFHGVLFVEIDLDGHYILLLPHGQTPLVKGIFHVYL